MNRTQLIHVRLTPQEMEVVRRATKRCGMTISEFVRANTLQHAYVIVYGDENEIKDEFNHTSATFINRLRSIGKSREILDGREIPIAQMELEL